MTARGRQPSHDQLMEELRMEINATAHDLIHHDRWEIDALRSARAYQRAGRLPRGGMPSI